MLQNNDFLKDQTFLDALDGMNIKIQYIKLILLSYDEKPIKELQGVVQNGGSISVNGASALRRTISFTMFADASNNDLTNIDNLISLNKKFKVYIGYKNLVSGYEKYGDIVWFKGGTFVISQASLSNSTTGSTISISGKDKMVKLNGTVGGTIPASIILHERQEIQPDGTIIISYPTIFQIIREIVSEYGEENLDNIIISDLEMDAKALVKYVGTKTLYISKDGKNFTEENLSEEELVNYTPFIYGQDIGYKETDFTFPGKLEMAAGSTVTQILDKIVKILGNYEYFYDIDGRFIFQEKKNYLNNQYTPLVNKNTQQYVKQFSDSKYHYVFRDMKQVTAINNNPNYENIKNDFIVWGKRTTAAGLTFPIRYHLAIDSKPQIDLAGKYMWAVHSRKLSTIEEYDNEGKVIGSKKLYVLGELLRYEYSNDSRKYVQFEPTEQEGRYAYNLIGKPCKDWREELYRQALERSKDGSTRDYDQELLAEWRKLYNPIPQTNSQGEKIDWYDEEAKEAWNPDVFSNPGSLDYWLDFLDDGDDLRKYSVQSIGRRTKVINKDTIRSIFNPEVQDILFVENNFETDDLKTADEYRAEKIQELNNKGQTFLFYQPVQSDIFSISSTGSSGYDEIRELIYQHLTYNCQVSITCFPKYYLEPNNLIYITNTNNGVYGSFVISSFNLPLSHEGTMTIQASQALERV